MSAVPAMTKECDPVFSPPRRRPSPIRPYAPGSGCRVAAGIVSVAVVTLALAGCRGSATGAPGGGAPTSAVPAPPASGGTGPGRLVDCGSQDRGGDPVRPYCPPAPVRPNVSVKITPAPAASNNPTPPSPGPSESPLASP